MPPAAPPIPLPKVWTKHTRAGVLYAVGLARASLVTARGWCANSPLARARLAAENDQLRSELALVREEMRIKDARFARVPPAQRPHYPPPERLAILTLRTAHGWSAEETARRFFVTAATIANWMSRLDEQGDAALVQTPTPVNRFPDLVRDLVSRLRATLPAMGTHAHAQIRGVPKHRSECFAKLLGVAHGIPPPPHSASPDSKPNPPSDHGRGGIGNRNTAAERDPRHRRPARARRRALPSPTGLRGRLPPRLGFPNDPTSLSAPATVAAAGASRATTSAPSRSSS